MEISGRGWVVTDPQERKKGNLGRQLLTPAFQPSAFPSVTRVHLVAVQVDSKSMLCSFSIATARRSENLNVLGGSPFQWCQQLLPSDFNSLTRPI